jgi:hypothetical protein
MGKRERPLSRRLPARTFARLRARFDCLCGGLLERLPPPSPADHRDQHAVFPEVEIVIFDERFLADRKRFAADPILNV